MVIRKKPQLPELLDYKKIYDVRSEDPELLPQADIGGRTRAQFAYRYLRAGLHDKYNGSKSYSKNRPGIAIKQSYFTQVKSRYEERGHIASFQGFLDAFS